MTVSSEEREFLLSEKGKGLLQLASELAQESKGDAASLTLNLKKKAPNLDSRLLKSCIETTLGRLKFKNRGGWINEGLFTSLGASQATNPLLANHHAKRLSNFETIAEIGTSLGFDTAALAKTNKQVISFEIDSVTASFAEHNLLVQGISNFQIKLGDGTKLINDIKFDAVWSDPARRDEKGSRFKNPEEYRPPVSNIIKIANGKPFGIKISSVAMGVSYGDTSREWIGFNDELTEQIIWRRVPVENDTVTFPEFNLSWNSSLEYSENKLKEFPEGEFVLVEPHAALIGSGVWHDFFASRNIEIVDKSEALGVVYSQLDPSPFYKQYKISAIFSLRIKEIQDYVTKNSIGKMAEFKKRGISESIDDFKKKIKFNGDQDAVFFMTHVGARNICLAGKRL